jgi:hypothetical protein
MSPAGKGGLLSVKSWPSVRSAEADMSGLRARMQASEMR